MKHPLLILFCLTYFGLNAQESLKIINQEPIQLGEQFSFRSDILDEERTLNIYLPPSYNPENKKSYPVIYLLDGSVDEDFIHIAGLVQFLTFSWLDIIPESIVVGIANVDRKRDFTFPSKNERDIAEFPTTGGSAKFIKCLEKEIKPLIENKYATNGTSTIIGQSLGGLLTTEIFFKHSHLFDNYLIVSPSLWWNDESLLQKSPAPLHSPKNVYIAVGKEGSQMENAANGLRFKLKLLDLENLKLHYNYFPELDHGDTLHKAAYDGLEKIFAKADDE